MNFLVRIKSLFCFSIMFLVSSSFAVAQGMEVDVSVQCVAGGKSTNKHIVIEDLGDIDEKARGHRFYGIYNGESSDVVNYVAEHLHENIVKDRSFSSSIKRALESAFLKTDNDLWNRFSEDANYNGSTAVVVIITPAGKIFIANLGDSGSMFIKKPSMLETKKHKFLFKVDQAEELMESREYQRIIAAGGNVSWADGAWRVGGELVMSRAFGYFSLKPIVPIINSFVDRRYWVTPRPSIYEAHFDVTDDEVLILGNNTFWDGLGWDSEVFDLKKYIEELRGRWDSSAESICYYLTLRSRRSYEGMLREEDTSFDDPYIDRCLLLPLFQKNIDDITAIVVIPQRFAMAE